MPPVVRFAKTAVFLLCSAPLMRLAMALIDGSLAANPMPEVIRSTGVWSLRLMIAGLALSPLGALGGWEWPLKCRRMVGLFAALYAAVHLAAWARYYDYDWAFLAGEAVAVPFLAIGLIGAVLLLPLTFTSPQRMHVALGPAVWTRIHALIYPTVVAVFVHNLMARRFDRTEAAIMGFMIALLVVWRLGRGFLRRVVLRDRPVARS